MGFNDSVIGMLNGPVIVLNIVKWRFKWLLRNIKKWFGYGFIDLKVFNFVI